jgi:hypothetical protein
MDSILRNTGKVKLSAIDIEQLPNHKMKSAKEWSSACPQCGGEDRFLFWPVDGNFWCRQCELSGFVDQESQATLTDDQRADIEYRKRQARQAEIDRQRTALEQLQAKRNDLTYHRNLNGNSGYVQQKWGVNDDTIDTFRIGYCNACPTSPYSASITIPYYWGDSLVNLRHRLSSPNGQGKYRPEAAGLPTAIFNANIIAGEDWLVLVEGEFKAMVLQQNGLPAIGIPGATNFKEKWLKLFSPKQMIYVALDPGVEPAAIKIVKMFSSAGLQARLVSIPTKPDDFFTLYGGTNGQFCQYLKAGRIC